MSQPTCINYGCNKLCDYSGTRKDRSKKWRLVCKLCHDNADNLRYYVNRGIKDFKKRDCENKDGHLGWVCKAEIEDRCQLDLDHIDGDKNNNVPENIRTLCKNCHSLKTKRSGDHSKPSQVKSSNTFSFWEEEQPTTDIFEEA